MFPLARTHSRGTIHARLPLIHAIAGMAALGRPAMPLTTILVIILILFLVGALPNWGYSRGWGYGPSGGVGVILIILVILMLTNRI